MGTAKLLESARSYWDGMNKSAKSEKGFFKILIVSTDEVFGSLKAGSDSFDESSSYKPNSPYSASKAASDMLARAWGQTYGLPIILTNCSNNYGPRQFPEKLIPKTISLALNGADIPIYGKGDQIRDWLYVDDHCAALLLAFEKASAAGSRYALGGSEELSNLDLVKLICSSS